MALQVATATIVVPAVTFAFTVPGQYRWTILSVCAVATRGAGGTPGRSYALSITDGTTEVTRAAAADAGTDPGTCTVTWADTSAAADAAGATGVSLGSLPTLTVDAGYVITGTIVGNVTGDTWTTAALWYDSANTEAPFAP